MSHILLDQYTEANKAVRLAEEQMEKLISRFQDIAHELRNWRTRGIEGIFPQGPEYKSHTQDTVSLNDIPKPDDIVEAYAKWRDAKTEMRRITSQLTDEQCQTLGINPR